MGIASVSPSLSEPDVEGDMEGMSIVDGITELQADFLVSRSICHYLWSAHSIEF